MTSITAKALYSFSICLILSFLVAGHSFAQSIYNGGKGDGFSIASVIQPDNVLLNIYGGGSADGFSMNCFAQPDNVLYNIYNGGNADGFTIGCFAQADNVLYDIYKGGNADGFSINCFAQADNVLYDIYKGGSADGFSINCFAQADNVLYDIYKGGNGDGVSMFCLGSIGTEVPLPVQLINFNGKYQNGQVLLQWKTASELNNDYFDVERSQNGIDYKALYQVKGAGTSEQENSYSVTDENPFPGINYYRLKQVDFDGKATYSGPIAVYADDAQPVMHIFPNPSDNNSIVQIRMQGVGEGTPVAVTITNMYGEVIHSLSAITDSSSNIQLPNSFTTGLASGVYIVSARFSLGQFTAKWVVR